MVGWKPTETVVATLPESLPIIAPPAQGRRWPVLPCFAASRLRVRKVLSLLCFFTGCRLRVFRWFQGVGREFTAPLRFG